MKRVFAAVIALLGASPVLGCAGRAQRAGGPPPEYERPTVLPWDAGKPVDPLEQAIQNAEPVTESQAPDAGDAAPASTGSTGTRSD